jgi:hypothetical protein
MIALETKYDLQLSFNRWRKKQNRQKCTINQLFKNTCLFFLAYMPNKAIARTTGVFFLVKINEVLSGRDQSF